MLVGFLKFLKREKKEDALEGLDLPPAPPSLEGYEESMPELPDFQDFDTQDISKISMELPKFDFPEKEENMPDFPSFPEMDEKPAAPIPPVSAPIAAPEPAHQIQEARRISEQEKPKFAPDAHPKIERRLFTHDRGAARERPSGKTLYVKVDKFKAALGTITMVRSDLRKSEEALIKLEDIKGAKDKSFDRVKSALDDLQKKLIFVDKTLFKGE